MTSVFSFPKDDYGQLCSILDWVRYCTSQLNQSDVYFGHGTDNAWDEAVVMVLFCVSLAPDMAHKTSDALFNARLVQAEKEQVVALLSERINTLEPLPYLTHQALHRDQIYSSP